MESIDIPETPLSPSHPIVVTTINGGLTIKTDDEEQNTEIVLYPRTVQFLFKEKSWKGDLPIIVANTECLNDDEWVFFGISFTSTIMVRRY